MPKYHVIHLQHNLADGELIAFAYQTETRSPRDALAWWVNEQALKGVPKHRRPFTSRDASRLTSSESLVVYEILEAREELSHTIIILKDPSK